MQIDFLSLIHFYNIFENVEFYFDIQEDQTVIDDEYSLLHLNINQHLIYQYSKLND